MDSDHLYFERWDTWELLSTPMLDTSFDRSQRAKVKAVLASRGISGRRKARLQLIAFTGLWWNVLWGEWVTLDLKDVVHGWSLNLGLVSGLVAGSGLYQTLMRLTLLDSVLSFFVAVPVGCVAFALVVQRVRPVLARRYAGAV